MKIATQIWLATALLQRERGLDHDIPVGDVVALARSSSWNGARAESLAAHVSSHCIATAKPSPDRYRMLTRTRRGHVRLFRRGDPYHPGRKDGPTHPSREEVPAELRHIVDWYDSAVARAATHAEDPILELREFSQRIGIWRGIDPDEYVRQLRADWD